MKRIKISYNYVQVQGYQVKLKYFAHKDPDFCLFNFAFPRCICGERFKLVSDI